ncbi:acetyl xylan esterase [Chryseobacterium piperi]|uniref:Acetyl xylan esterase n=1 Tax=Chryseobacterium piperi TaxID=558152 RepID=A0A086BB12_9FLAO|nr:sialate O-acetylesterase [Chryseobacterium piperi]ASW75870.1 sialate O-acetylesterase [Chryseobacterium piperi]KFF26126.1 acetyl xylan esterase [Chryseobacterium piperi]
MTYSFLMIGQSNMAGRGFLQEVHPIHDEKIKMLRNGRWQMIAEPINFDRPTSGISLAASFASSWRLFHNHKDDIGLIPCADGGTSLEDWAVEEPLFQHAVSQAKAAQKISTLAGILWHQGESDSHGQKYQSYQEKLSVIIEALREELNVPDIPLIIGGLGNFLTDGMYGQYFSEYNDVNESLIQFAKDHDQCYFVSAEGLTANPDNIHFDAISQRKLGVRYFRAFEQKANIPGILADEDQVIEMINNRPLTKNEKYELLQYEFAMGIIDANTFQQQFAKLT